MSRCFPYPPPGYARNGVRDEALIESIKRETENAGKERKEEKKRRKREKEKAREEGESNDRKYRHKRKHRNGSQENSAGGDHHKKQRTDSKHTEKSSLTEEHGQPVSSQNSTESTLNSSNDQQTPLSLSPEGRQKSVSTIRIQLHLQRQRGPEVNLHREQPCSSATGRTVSNASLVTSQTCGNVPRTSWDRMAPKKSLISSPKGRESSAPRTISNASMAASQMYGTVPRNNGDREVPEKFCSTSSSMGQESFDPGRKINDASVAGSGMRRTVPRTSLDSAEIEKSFSVTSLKGQATPNTGRTITDASLAASQMCRIVPQTSGARTGQEQSSLRGRTISTSLVSPQMCGIVPQTSGDKRGTVPQTSANCFGQEHLQLSSVPGRTSAKPQIRGTVSQSSGDRSKPGQLSSSSSLDDPHLHGLYLGKDKDSHLYSGAVAETSVQRGEPSSAPSSRRDRPSSSELKYAKLVEDWLPPCFPNGSEDGLDEQEWLFKRQRADHDGDHLNVNDKEGKVENCGVAFTHNGNPNPGPRVCFLPEADVYALPYTVPY